MTRRTATVQKWEYEAVEMPATASIADYGKDGWELVAVVNVANSSQVVLYFKRPIK